MRMTVNNRFGILLAEKRIKERRAISLAEVAESTGISRKTLYAWENNTVHRFDVPVIDAICEYFGIEPGQLFQYVNDGKEKEMTDKQIKDKMRRMKGKGPFYVTVIDGNEKQEKEKSRKSKKKPAA